MQQFTYYNQSIFVDIPANDFPNCDNALIVWVAKNDMDTFVVGWSDRGVLYSQKQHIAHEMFGGLNLSYHVKTKSELTHIILPENCTCSIPNGLFPMGFVKNGFCRADDITDFDMEDVLAFMKGYSADFHVVGLLDEAISSLAHLTETNPNKLVALSRKTDVAYRSLWIANLAVKQKDCYETKFNRADALRYAGVLENAFDDFRSAVKMKPELDEPKIECIKLCVMLNRTAMLRELISRLDSGVLEKYFKKPELNVILELANQ